MVLLQLTSHNNIMMFHLNNIIAIALIRKMEGTFSPTLCKKSLLLSRQAIQRKLTILPPLWLTLQENTKANFLSRHSLKRWYFRLANSPKLCAGQRLQGWPILDAFASRRSHQIPRDQGNSFMSRVDRSNLVALVGRTENKIGSNQFATSSVLPQLLKGEH